MGKIDWKAKLASRKFWALVAAFVTSAVLFAQGDPTMTTGAVVLDFGAVVAYVLGESMVDAASVKSETTSTTITGTIREAAKAEADAAKAAASEEKKEAGDE